MLTEMKTMLFHLARVFTAMRAAGFAGQNIIVHPGHLSAKP
jgi:hypothetical protein